MKKQILFLLLVFPLLCFGQNNVPDATIKTNTNTLIRNATTVTRANHSLINDELTDSKLSRIEYNLIAGTNTYTASIPWITSYNIGLTVPVFFTNSNTGASTINFSSLGNINIQKNGAGLSSGDIISGRPYTLIYDGTNFVLSGGASISNLATNHIFVGDGLNRAVDVAMSGDVSIVSSGVTTVTRILGNPIPGNAAGNLQNDGTGVLSWAPASGGNPFADNGALVKNNSDNTKTLTLSAASITTGTNRTWIFPDVNGTVARIDAAQTFAGTQTFSSVPSLPSQSANLFYASPNGSSGVPSFRAVVASDIPTLNQNTTGTASNLSGTPALPNGTTATTQTPGDNSTKLATTAYVDISTVNRATMGDADATWTSGKTITAITAAFTAHRTLTLPAASSFLAGKEIKIVDEAGAVTPTNYLTITRAGSDVINNITSVDITNAYSIASLVTDGSSKWTIRKNTELYSIVTISGSTFTLNFQNDEKATFAGSAAVTANFTVAFSNNNHSKKFEFKVKLNGTALTMTCPSNWTMLSGDPNWNSSTQIYTFPGTLSNLNYDVDGSYNTVTGKWEVVVSGYDFK